MPAPTAAPLIAAMYGLSRYCSACGTRCTVKRNEFRRSPGVRSCCSTVSSSSRAFRSAPAQNARPLPVTTTTRTSSSAIARLMPSLQPASSPPLNEFMRSGRFRVIVAIRSSTEYRTSCSSLVMGPPAAADYTTASSRPPRRRRRS